MDAGTDAAVDGGPDGGPDGGEPQGACDNESDLAALDGAGSSPRDLARDCGAFECAIFFGNGFAYESCVDGCVQDDIPDLSPACATCHGASERCSHDSLCILRCRNNTCSAMCLDCMTSADCIAELEECTGIPDDGCADAP